MSFVQILEYETDQPDQVAALAAGRMGEMSTLPPGYRLLVTQDRDNARRYVTIIEFPSEEAASRATAENNSAEFLSKFAPLCTSGPKFSYLTVNRTIG